jgi:hypothetical protein
MRWLVQVVAQGGPGLVGLVVGLVLGRLWALSAPPPPPPVNPWATRPCREWDGGERWTACELRHLTLGGIRGKW